MRPFVFRAMILSRRNYVSVKDVAVSSEDAHDKATARLGFTTLRLANELTRSRPLHITLPRHM